MTGVYIVMNLYPYPPEGGGETYTGLGRKWRCNDQEIGGPKGEMRSMVIWDGHRGGGGKGATVCPPP